MPKKLHRELAARATRKGLTGKRRGAYIHGTLNRVERRRKKRTRRRKK